MRVNELIDLLIRFRDGEDEEGRDGNVEVRVGDQLEAGPYEHFPIGGIWLSALPGKLIVVANPDDLGEQEPTTNKLQVLWINEL